MTIEEIKASGIEALDLATQLLQRARLADRQSGLWESADVQWSWRIRRRSDDAEKLFWIDDEGPVAGILLTSSPDGSWQCDPVIVPNVSGPAPGNVWERALEHAATHSWNGFDIPVCDEDRTFQQLARKSGFTAVYGDSTAWMDATDRPEVLDMPEGFVITNRSGRGNTPHHMSGRNGDAIAERLEQCSLYDPVLDLAIETTDGQIAGYSLYWFDPITKVSLVEPVRVEDDFQRRGLARAMLTIGLSRLVARGAQRIKVSYETDAAGALYLGAGFRQTSTATWYRAPSE